MLIQEMHNKIELRLQKMASHAYDWIQSPQVDSYINDTILAYVKNRVNSFSESRKAPFQRNIKSMEDLKTLVVPGYTLRAYSVDSGEFFESDLPADYMFMVESTSFTADKCKFPNGFPTPTSYTIYSAEVTLPHNLKSISIGTTELINLTTQQIQTDSSAAFIMHNNLRSILNNSLCNIYFLNGDKYLFVSKATSLPEVITVTQSLGDTFPSNTFNWSSVTKQAYPTSDSFTKVRNRIIEQEQFTHYFDHPFAKTMAHSPSGFVYDRFLKIHTNKRFILSNVEITYIRKPRLVDLYSNTSCDLPEHTHQEIVDKTVLDILETIESRRTQSKQVLNQLNE